MGTPLAVIKQQLSIGDYRNSFATTAASSHVFDCSPEMEMLLDEPGTLDNLKFDDAFNRQHKDTVPRSIKKHVPVARNNSHRLLANNSSFVPQGQMRMHRNSDFKKRKAVPFQSIEITSNSSSTILRQSRISGVQSTIRRIFK